MLTHFQKMLMDDLQSPDSYGTPLVGWSRQTEFFKNPAAPANPGFLIQDLASTFVEATYVLLRTRRPVRIYRGYETAGLTAPFGMDHPSYLQNLVTQRRPGTPDGRWWTPARPSLEIDQLGLSDMHRSEPRDSSAIKLEWNRLDFYLESELPIGSTIYVGRAAPQQEKAAYGQKKYGGGGMQFRLNGDPAAILSWMKRYAAS
jgi:hypothetical protein